MFGYMEEEYIVLENFEVNKDGLRHVFEIRIENQSEEILQKKLDYLKRFSKNPKIEEAESYIAFTCFNEDDVQVNDILFNYFTREKGVLEKDWEQFKKSPDINIKEMLCDSWIVGHATGYTKSGNITMF